LINFVYVISPAAIAYNNYINATELRFISVFDK
jgi:hypothetical protein